MSLQIDQIALHQWTRALDQRIQIQINDHLLDPKSEPTILLINTLHRHFTYKAKQFAYFCPESAFMIALKQNEQDLTQHSEAFLTFSKQQLQRLVEQASENPAFEAGTIVFCRYQYLAHAYLMIAFLSDHLSLNVNAELGLSQTHYLDVEHCDRLLQIDLTAWKTEPDSTRYLAFLNGRLPQRNAEFFLNYLNAQAGVEVKLQNQLLNQSVEAYCQMLDCSEKEKKELKKQVYEYGKAQWQQGEDLEIAAINQQLPHTQTTDFQQFIAQAQTPLAESFPADRRVLRQLQRYQGSGGGLTIGFDSALLGERIVWNEAQDQLVITGLPPNLRDQLKKSK